METEPRSFVEQLSLLWAKLNSSEKLIIVASVLIFTVALTVWVSVTRQPANALLYGNLEPTDAGQVISELQSRNISYQVKNGGASIFVPAENVDELRISLAADGFMPSGIGGYEILEASPLGISDRTQRVRITQALEGELARTLSYLDEVKSARVHLTLPQPTPFIAEQEEPVASVVLNVIPPGSVISNDKIGAIRTFVAGAIGGGADNVTIIDQNMNLLTGPSASQPGGLMPSQEEARRGYELEKAADIRFILEKVYGLGKVAVSFSVEMDFDEVSTESISYEPLSGTTHGVLSQEERTSDSTQGEGYLAPVGVPGTDSNIPSYVAAGGEPYSADSETESKIYEISTTHETRTQALGTIKRRTVGVIIDSGEKDPADIGVNEITEIESIIASGVGLDLTGSDNLTVAFRQFDTTLRDDLAKPLPMSQAAMQNLAIKIGLILFMLIVGFMVLKAFMKPVEGGILAFAGPSPADEEEIEVDLPDADPETLEKIRIRDEIERLIKDDPSSASKVIKTWLKE